MKKLIEIAVNIYHRKIDLKTSYDLLKQHHKQTVLKVLDDAQSTDFWVKYEDFEDYYKQNFEQE
jgi:hypothetical protein